MAHDDRLLQFGSGPSIFHLKLVVLGGPQYLDRVRLHAHSLPPVAVSQNDRTEVPKAQFSNELLLLWLHQADAKRRCIDPDFLLVHVFHAFKPPNSLLLFIEVLQGVCVVPNGQLKVLCSLICEADIQIIASHEVSEDFLSEA